MREAASGSDKVYLERVDLRNFRPYRLAELTFGSSGLTVVTGPNNSGKTALLSALAMVGGQPVEGPLGFAGGVGQPEVQAFYTVDPSERQRLAESVDEAHRGEAVEAIVGSVFTFGEGHDNAARLAIVGIAVVRSDGQRWPVAEVQLAPGGSGSGSVRLVDWGSWLNAWPDKPTPNQSISGGVSRYLEQDLGPTTLPRALTEWRSGFYHFRSLRTGARGRKGTSAGEPTLESTGSNLHNHLLWLRGHREDDWERIRATMRDLIPDVGRLQVRVAGGESEAGFEVPGLGFINIKDAGTGVEQLLLTMVVGQTAAASMLIVEEPETNLHPGAQRQLMRHLVEWSKHRPVIIATHSPVIIDSAPGARLYEVSRHAGASTVRPIQRDVEMSDLLSRLGVRFSDVLGSERVLVVEGPRDKTILEVWFPELESHSTVAVVPGGGGGGVWHMQLMEDVSRAADHLPRPVLYLRDRDELSDRDLTRLAKLRAVAVLPRRELENYLLEPAAISSVLAARRPEMSAPKPEDVAVAIRAAADGLRGRVIVSRVLENAECLRRLIPVVTRERLAIFHAADPARALLNLVRAKLESNLESLEGCIRQAFESETAWVTERWPAEWQAIVPGADVLAEVFALHGGYSKDIDGRLIARAIAEPPKEIADTVRRFLAE